MRDGEILFRIGTLAESIRKQGSAQFLEALRLDALIQLLIDKKIIIKKDLEDKMKFVQEDVKRRIEEAKNKPKIITPNKEIIK